MIALAERGREIPSRIQLFTENLAQRNLLSFPPGLRVGRGSFSGNNARDFSKVGFWTERDISYRGRPYDRPCRARPRNAFPNPGFHGKSRAAKPPLLPAGTQGRKRSFLGQQRARYSEVEFKIVFPQSSHELGVSQGINKTLDSERNFNFESDTKTEGEYLLPWAAL